MNDRLDKLIQGDNQTWQDLYAEINPGLFRFLLSRLGDEGAAQDLLQEGFYRLAKNLRQIKDARAIRAWIYSTCYRLSVDWQRRNKVYRTEELPSLEDPEAVDPAAAAVQREESQAVLQAVLSLSDPHRTVILLRIWGGLSYREISEITGVSKGTLRSQYYWAVRKLRSIFKNHDSGLWKDVTANE